ncbi:hypothetical protein C8Q78DRAFT_1062280 [Trametes maxima]|nr:hypothetical protein C8Q78DRAFT_1062280 [Trametes maxima]
MSASSLWLALWFSFLVTLARSQAPAQSIFPASMPLAIRSPFMSVWYSSTNGSNPISNSWPLFWGQSSIMGWAGKIRVDGQTYSWLGNDAQRSGTANVTNVQFTPTRTIFTMQAGPMSVTVTFLSPIEPSDWVLQSLPFSYVSVEANSLDGQAHSVQVYSDISAEWQSGDRSSQVRWSQHTTGGSIYHEIDLQNPVRDAEINHQAQDGITYFAMATRPSQTWQIDRDSTVRSKFQSDGTLPNTATNNFGPISPAFSVYAIAADLGQISSTSEPIAWAIGYVRNPSIAYTAPNGATQELAPYFVTKYGNDIGQAIDAVTSSFGDVLQRAVAFDQAIIGNATQVSSHYADLVSLAARQAIGSLDITVSTGSDGNANASDVRIFMKDIGSTSSTERVNPVERIFAALPALVYVNSSFIGPLLAPLLDAQDSLTGQPYAAQDIGLAYPNATGTHGAHQQGIEQSGNMLIALYAHARFSGDGSLLNKHYNLTKRWADYLVNNTLTPTNQFSADEENTANMTNLAIKGIIGVKAMAEISRALGEDSDAQQYDSHAAALVGSWQSLALSTDQKHLLGAYGNPSSWALMYNIYADRLLGTNLVSQTVLEGQTTFYQALLGSSAAFGVPIDSQLTTTASTAWSLLTAGTVTDNDVRNHLIDGVWNRINSNLTGGAFPERYDVGTGKFVDGTAGPAGGAMFSLLALNVPNTTISTTPGSGGSRGSGSAPGSSSSSKSSTGAIVGGVVGAIVAISLVAVGIFFFLRRRHRRPDSHREDEKMDVLGEPHRPALSPYSYPQQDSYGVSSLEAGTYGHADAPPQPIDLVNSHTSLVSPPPLGLAAVAGAGAGAGDDALHSATQSAKMREVALNARLAYAESESGFSNANESHAGTASNRDPLSPGESRSTFSGTGSRSGASRSGASGSLSPTEVLGLRAEVENLRRVMQEIRAERLEPPPEYTG